MFGAEFSKKILPATELVPGVDMCGGSYAVPELIDPFES
jgi:hypothetical protein